MGNSLYSKSASGANNSSSTGNEQEKLLLYEIGQRVSFSDQDIVLFYRTYERYCTKRKNRTIDTSSAVSRNEQHQHDEQNEPSVLVETTTSSISSSITTTTAVPVTAESPASSPTASSFFTDWYGALLEVASSSSLSSPSSYQQQKQKLDMIQFIVQYILPPNFDTVLHQTCFVLQQPQEQFIQCNNDNNADYKEQVLHFFHTLAVCNGRRSSKDSITVLFRTVQQLQQQVIESSSSSSSNTTTSSSSTAAMVSAKLLIETGYRIAIAIAYIEEQLLTVKQQQQQSTHNDDDNIVNAVSLEQSQPQQQSSTETRTTTTTKTIESYHPLQFDTAITSSLRAMSDSVVAIRNQRRLLFHQQGNDDVFLYNATSGVVVTEEKEDSNNHRIDDAMIELEDVLEWIETAAPMFPYILSTLFQYLLYPNYLNVATTLATTNSNNDSSINPQQQNVELGRTMFTIPKILDRKLENIRTRPTSQTTSTTTGITTDTLLTPITTTTSSNVAAVSPLLSLLSVRHFIVSCINTTCNGFHYPIYNSNIDGLSFNRLLNSIIGYNGPTLFVIQSTSGGIFGAYTGTSWKLSNTYYGNTDSCLYQLHPNFAVYRPKGGSSTTSFVSSSSFANNNNNNKSVTRKISSTEMDSTKNYMYCNSTARSKGYDQQVHGIGLGGTIHNGSIPRLFLSEDNFGDIHTNAHNAAAQDLTYDNGQLLPHVGQQQGSSHSSDGFRTSSSSISLRSSSSTTNNNIQRHRSLFDLECCEVYGVSNHLDVIQNAIGARTTNRQQQADMINRARKVDKAQFLNDLQSGMIDNKMFVHRQQVDGRVNLDNDDDDDENTNNKDSSSNPSNCLLSS